MPPFARCSFMAGPKPLVFIQKRSESVLFVPGSIRRSAPDSSSGVVMKRRSTLESPLKGSKSVKLDTRGSFMTATFTLPLHSSLLPYRASSETLSSSGRLRLKYGTTPTTCLPVRFWRNSMPGSRRALSPLNLFMMRPLILSLSLYSRSSSVPTMEAKTPPLSMSPIRRTGLSTASAMPMLAMSFSRRFTSAGLPAPSITMMSFVSASFE